MNKVYWKVGDRITWRGHTGVIRKKLWVKDMYSGRYHNRWEVYWEDMGKSHVYDYENMATVTKCLRKQLPLPGLLGNGRMNEAVRNVPIRKGQTYHLKIIGDGDIVPVKVVRIYWETNNRGQKIKKVEYIWGTDRYPSHTDWETLQAALNGNDHLPLWGGGMNEAVDTHTYHKGDTVSYRSDDGKLYKGKVTAVKNRTGSKYANSFRYHVEWDDGYDDWYTKADLNAIEARQHDLRLPGGHMNEAQEPVKKGYRVAYNTPYLGPGTFKVLKKKGTAYYVRWDDGSEGWMTASRLKFHRAHAQPELALNGKMNEAEEKIPKGFHVHADTPPRIGETFYFWCCYATVIKKQNKQSFLRFGDGSEGWWPDDQVSSHPRSPQGHLSLGYGKLHNEGNKPLDESICGKKQYKVGDKVVWYKENHNGLMFNQPAWYGVVTHVSKDDFSFRAPRWSYRVKWDDGQVHDYHRGDLDRHNDPQYNLPMINTGHMNESIDPSLAFRVGHEIDFWGDKATVIKTKGHRYLVRFKDKSQGWWEHEDLPHTARGLQPELPFKFKGYMNEAKIKPHHKPRVGEIFRYENREYQVERIRPASDYRKRRGDRQEYVMKSLNTKVDHEIIWTASDFAIVLNWNQREMDLGGYMNEAHQDWPVGTRMAWANDYFTVIKVFRGRKYNDAPLEQIWKIKYDGHRGMVQDYNRADMESIENSNDTRERRLNAPIQGRLNLKRGSMNEGKDTHFKVGDKLPGGGVIVARVPWGSSEKFRWMVRWKGGTKIAYEPDYLETLIYGRGKRDLLYGGHELELLGGHMKNEAKDIPHYKVGDRVTWRTGDRDLHGTIISKTVKGIHRKPKYRVKWDTLNSVTIHDAERLTYQDAGELKLKGGRLNEAKHVPSYKVGQKVVWKGIGRDYQGVVLSIHRPAFGGKKMYKVRWRGPDGEVSHSTLGAEHLTYQDNGELPLYSGHMNEAIDKPLKFKPGVRLQHYGRTGTVHSVLKGRVTKEVYVLVNWDGEGGGMGGIERHNARDLEDTDIQPRLPLYRGKMNEANRHFKPGQWVLHTGRGVEGLVVSDDDYYEWNDYSGNGDDHIGNRVPVKIGGRGDKQITLFLPDNLEHSTPGHQGKLRLIRGKMRTP